MLPKVGNQKCKHLKKSAVSFVAGVMIVALLAILTFPTGGYASSPMQTAMVTSTATTSTYPLVSYVMTTETGTFYGNPGQLQCSPVGCVYLPGPYQYRVNPNAAGYYNGVYYAYVNGNYFPPCQPDLNHRVTCSGFLEQPPSGCTELVVVVANGYIPENYWYQYYTLRNVTTNAELTGQFVTVTGQMFTGSNISPTGAACPGTYINVTSVA